MMAEKVKKKFGKNLEKNINEVSDNDSENEEQDKKETDVQLQKRLKADFIQAAQSEDESESEIIKVKPKTAADLKKEKEEMEKIVIDEEQQKFDQDKFLKEFWGHTANKKLTEEDKFLRNYILGEKWKETNEEFDQNVDEEDFERDSEMEEFEENYNFRFEERDGDKIRTYPRTIEDTYRIARNKRMENKIAKKKRMKEFLKEKKQEREQIASIKKKEIIEKLKQAQDIAGSEDVALKIAKELETDFDPKMYDKIMAKAFDEEYYNQDDEKEKVFEKTIVDDYGEISRYDEKPKDDIKDEEMEEEQQKNPQNDDEEDKESYIKSEEDKRKQLKHLMKKREVKQVFKDLEQEDNYDVWYACDGCFQPIKPGKFMFECKI
jgi:protein KRI1